MPCCTIWQTWSCDRYPGQVHEWSRPSSPGHDTATPASPATLRTDRAPLASGGRQLTLYLKVAIDGPPNGPLMVRGGWASSTWSPRFSSGIVRLVESAVNPSRRNTKARRGSSRALALLPLRCLPPRQYLWVMVGVLRLSRPVERGVNSGADTPRPANLGVLRALALPPHEG